MAFNLADHTIECANGYILRGDQLKGKLVAIVNTASQCGFARQWQCLMALHQKIAPNEWSIIAFPCNQFGAQEPLDNNSVCQWLSPDDDHVYVAKKMNALIEEPLYQWIIKEASWWSQPRWNFYVYWLNQSGELIQCWKPWQLFSGYRAERDLCRMLG